MAKTNKSSKSKSVKKKEVKQTEHVVLELDGAKVASQVKKMVATVKPIPKGMMELRVRHSLTLIYLHEVVCVSLGKCLCTVKEGKRDPKVEHLHPGILYIVPKVMLSHNPLKKLRRKGMIFPKI